MSKDSWVEIKTVNKWRKKKSGAGSDAKTIDYSPLPTSRPTTSRQGSVQATATLERLRSLFFIAEHDVLWHGIFLWSVQVCCPACVISHPLALTYLPGEKKWETEKGFMLCKLCSALAKTPVCCQHNFIHKSTAPYGAAMKHSIPVKTSMLCFSLYLPWVPLLNSMMTESICLLLLLPLSMWNLLWWQRGTVLVLFLRYLRNSF